MKASNIESLLNALGSTRISVSGIKVRSTCPLARWRHTSGNDSHPSFVVFAADDDESRCRCLGASCGFKGGLIELLWAYGKHAKIDVNEYINFIHKNDHADIGAKLERIKNNLGIYTVRDPASITPWTGGADVSDPFVLADASQGIEPFNHLVDEMVNGLNDESMAYLNGPERALNAATISKWKIGWHSGARRVSVPQYDRNGRLVNIGGRFLSSKIDNPFWTPPKWMHADGFKKELFLFGEDRLTSYDGKLTGFLVEGMFDVVGLDMWSLPNVLGMLGAYISAMQYKKLTTWFDRLIIIPDGDPEGYKAADRILNQVGQKIRTEIYPTPMGSDPDQLGEERVSHIIREYLS